MKRWGRGGVISRLLIFFGVLAILLAIIGAVMWFQERRMTFPGAYMDFGPLPPAPVEAQTLSQPIEDGQVEAWYFPGEGASADRPAPTVVFLHGNGEVIDFWAAEMLWFSRRGFNVLLPEYRGYGRSDGSPSQDRIAGDLHRWVDQLVERPEVDAQRLIYIGHSIGGGVNAQLMAYRPPAATILQSTFVSLAQAAHDLVSVPTWLIRDPLPVRDILEDFDGPALILHGEDDKVVSITHAQANARAAKSPTLVQFPGIGHNPTDAGSDYWQAIERFLRDAELWPDGSTPLP